MNGYQYKCYYEAKEFAKCEAPKEQLGAIYAPESTCFRVWAPLADRVSLCLYRTGTDRETGAEKLEEIEMLCRGENQAAVYEADVMGELHGVYYTYLVEREGTIQECNDPYGKACGANGHRSMVVNPAETDPEGWEEDKSWYQQNENTAIYELHVKDFSWQKESGIAPAYRGKYLAFTQTGTTFQGRSTCLDYLKELGITHVHLLPIFDYASVDETGDGSQFNWGYDPMNYNVPEGSYATDCYRGETRIIEVKQMVQALHKAGIGVVMDVVYNHTYASDGAFHILAPYYYYRQKEDGSLSNGSGCGNETASERVMCGKFIRESIRYWAEEYHIDGFRFDLMGLHDTDTMNAIRQELDTLGGGKDILLYGEPWTGGDSPMGAGHLAAVKANIRKLDERIAVFHDDTRDTVKGSVFIAETPGFINGADGLAHEVVQCYRGWCCPDTQKPETPLSPRQVINYVSVHDNYTLWDKLVLTGRQDRSFTCKDKKLIAMNKMAAGIIFTCMGTPLFQAGEEFARTKLGDENSYKSSADINCLDWKRRVSYHDLTEYYRGFLALRSRIAVYRDKSLAAARKIQVWREEANAAALLIDNSGYSEEQEWQEICIICNSNDRRVSFPLPDGSWEILINKKSAWLWKNNSIWSKIKKKRTVTVNSKEILLLGKR